MITANEAQKLSDKLSTTEIRKQEIDQLMLMFHKSIRYNAERGKHTLINDRQFINDDFLPDLEKKLKSLGYVTNLTNTEFIIEW